MTLLTTACTNPTAASHAETTAFHTLTKNPANGPANHAPTALRNPHTAAQIVWKKWVLVATQMIAATSAAIAMMMIPMGLASNAASSASVTTSHASCTALTAEIADDSSTSAAAAAMTTPAIALLLARNVATVPITSAIAETIGMIVGSSLRNACEIDVIAGSSRVPSSTLSRSQLAAARLAGDAAALAAPPNSLVSSSRMIFWASIRWPDFSSARAWLI